MLAPRDPSFEKGMEIARSDAQISNALRELAK